MNIDDDDGQADASPWNPNQEQAAALLATGSKAKAAAEAVGVSDRTVRRWVADRAFASHVASLRDLAIGATIGRLADGSLKAVDKLLTLVDSLDESIALRASTAILDYTIKVRDHAEMAARVAALEAQAQQTAKGDDW
jgi:hypothetical protein